jgi:hypothetical protein
LCFLAESHFRTQRASDRHLVAHSDETGRFLLKNVPAGHQVMWIDGTSANSRGLSYGIFEDGVDILTQKMNVLSYTIGMTALDTINTVTLPSPAKRETIAMRSLNWKPGPRKNLRDEVHVLPLWAYLEYDWSFYILSDRPHKSMFSRTTQ